MFKSLFALVFAGLSLVVSTTEAACEHELIQLSENGLVPVPAAAKEMKLQLPSLSKPMAISDGKIENGNWKATALAISKIKGSIGGLSEADRRKVTLSPVMSDDLSVASYEFLLPGEDKAKMCGAAEATETAVSVTPASAQECQSVALTYPPGVSVGQYVKPLLFNTAGAACRTPPVLRHNDFLLVGILVKSGEVVPAGLSTTFANCAQETPAPVIYSSGNLSTVIKQATGEAPPPKQPATLVYWQAGQACASDAPQIAIHLGSGDQASTVTHTLSQYKRYRASIHLGALYTDQHEPRYALHTETGQNIIENEAADDKGIEYVGTVVIHGILHYIDALGHFTNGDDPGRWPYKGRDLVNERGRKDLLGLVVSAGLKDPGNRFGLGLSYEIAHGVNLIGVYELVKTKRLDGVAVGDVFAGTVDQLPKKDFWDKSVSIGVTFDIAYVTQIFTGGGN